MNFQNKKNTITRYEKKLDEYGIDPRAMGWRDKQQQYMRFAILSQIGNLNNHSVLDIGCGFGDFFDFLTQKKIKIEYTGYDISSKLIRIAKRKYPRGTFKVKDISVENPHKKFDYVISSGIFNYKLSDNKDFLKQMLRKSFEFCNMGVAFNMISSYVDYQDKHLYYFSPEEIFTFAKSLTKRTLLRHDYMPYEFTIYLYKREDINDRNIFVEACDYSPRINSEAFLPGNL